jgi:hypothetical protein
VLLNLPAILSHLYSYIAALLNIPFLLYFDFAKMVHWNSMILVPTSNTFSYFLELILILKYFMILLLTSPFFPHPLTAFIMMLYTAKPNLSDKGCAYVPKYRHFGGSPLQGEKLSIPEELIEKLSSSIPWKQT